MSEVSTNLEARGAKRSRGRTGCLNCRARRKKCDETKPICSRCQSCNDVCKWDEVFPFRSTGISAQHPSMQQSRSKTSCPELQIIDINFDHGSKRRKRRSLRVENDASENAMQDLDTPTHGDVSNENDTGVEYDRSETQSASLNIPQQHPVSESSHNRVIGHPLDSSENRPISAVSQNTNVSGTTRETTTMNQTSVPGTNFTPLATGGHHFDGMDLGTLDFLTSYTSNIDMLASAVQMGDISTWSPENEFSMLSGGDHLSASSPDMYAMYYPNAQYRELHSTLHQHMVETARTTALNRQASPEPTVDVDQVRTTSPSTSFIAPSATGILVKGSYLKCELVTPKRQLELWRNYLDEIAPWLDMLDGNRHFQTTVPLMAKSSPHLHYSILSLSARQIERRSPERSYTESLGLYQQAIQMIVHRLHNLETDVITSCVLLCVLEMMSSSPRAWARHLDGCAMLLEAAGINGAVGGVRQAIFWCFARMDLWGGYLGDTITKIPTNRWFIPSGSMAVAVNQFKDGARADTYANYAVFLCASAVNVISTQEMSQQKRSQASDSSELYSTRWKALYDLLEDWCNDRPEELLPLMNEQPAANDYQNPFPIVLYATSPGVSGNQMYHAAALLMLQQKPKEVRLPKSRKSILWHARQICGIAASNADHSAWTNALQPLWMAGKVMSHPSEHQAILDVLHRIEKETGFATEWRAHDLKEYWGDASD